MSAEKTAAEKAALKAEVAATKAAAEETEAAEKANAEATEAAEAKIVPLAGPSSYTKFEDGETTQVKAEGEAK